MDAAGLTNWQQLSEALRRHAAAEYGVDLLAVTFHLSYLGDTRKPLALPGRAALAALPAIAATPAEAEASGPPPAAAGPRPTSAESYPLDPWHTESFEMVCVEGEKYTFGPVARLIVRRLWEAWEANRPDVETETLRRVSGAQTQKLSTLFAGNNAWGKLIVKGAGSSCYRLFMRCASDPPVESAADDE